MRKSASQLRGHLSRVEAERSAAWRELGRTARAGTFNERSLKQRSAGEAGASRTSRESLRATRYPSARGSSARQSSPVQQSPAESAISPEHWIAAFKIGQPRCRSRLSRLCSQTFRLAGYESVDSSNSEQMVCTRGSALTVPVDRQRQSQRIQAGAGAQSSLKNPNPVRSDESPVRSDERGQPGECRGSYQSARIRRVR